MWLAGVLMVGYDARLEILVPVSSVRDLGLSDRIAVKEPKTRLIAADLVRVPLRPGHHKQAETTAQRQAQDERQGGPEDGEERRQAHD